MYGERPAPGSSGTATISSGCEAYTCAGAGVMCPSRIVFSRLSTSAPPRRIHFLVRYDCQPSSGW